MTGTATPPPLASGDAVPAGQHASASAQLALAAVTCGAIVSWVRLFDGAGWLAPLLAVAVTGHVVAATARRARLAVAVSILVSLVVSILVYCWTAVPSTTVAGIPGTGTLATFSRQLDDARQAFQTVQAPTAALGGFVLVLAVLVWAVTVTSDWLAFRLQARAEALVPAAGLFLIGTILGGPPRRTAAVLVFAPPVLAFVLLHRSSKGQRPANRIAVGDGGQRRLLGTGSVLAAAAVLVGTVAVGALPGANRHTLLDWRNENGGGARVTLSPLVDVRSHLTSGADALLFVVRADRPSYWRLSTLDEFNGQVWGSSGTFKSASDNLPGTKDAYGGHWKELAQSYSINALSEVWAPAAALPASIPRSSVKLRWDAEAQTLIVAADDATTDGASYSVVSKVPDLSPAVLEAATDPAPDDIQQHDTELPADFPVEVQQLASEVTAGSATPYDKALQLQRYFRDNPHFTYSTTPNIGESSNAIVAFLSSGEGFCEQFAGTYAAMARSIGLPTRLAVGFTPGIPDPKTPGQFLVYGRQYHAWPEVYFSGIGWVAFDPTPGRGAPGAQSYTGIPAQQDTGGLPSAPPETAPQGPSGPATSSPGGSGPPPPTTVAPPQATHPQAAPLPPTAAAARHGSGTAWWWWALLGVAVALALVLALFAVPCWFLWRRRRRRGAARTHEARVAVAWIEACEALSLLTPAPQPAETRLEFARRAGPAVPAVGDALLALAHLATRSAWAPTAPVDAGHAERLAAEAEARVRTALGRWGVLRRVVGWQLLRPGRRVLDESYSSRWNRSRIRSVVLSR
jgi:transglutaminase-like putative cysteine protease